MEVQQKTDKNNYWKIRYQLKKEEIKQKYSEKYTCECGALISIGSKKPHEISVKHAYNLLLNKLKNNNE